MKVLAKRLNPETGKQQILVYYPKTTDGKQDAKMDKIMANLCQQYGLSTEFSDCGDAMYQSVDTELCFIALCSGEWAGQIVQMEKDWLDFTNHTRLMIVIREFKDEYYYLDKRLKRLPDGKFADKEVQRLFEFYRAAFEAAAEYQGNAKATQWQNADDFMI